jgi:hypothetical protein
MLSCFCSFFENLQGCVLWRNWWPMLTGLSMMFTYSAGIPELAAHTAV